MKAVPGESSDAADGSADVAAAAAVAVVAAAVEAVAAVAAPEGTLVAWNAGPALTGTHGASAGESDVDGDVGVIGATGGHGGALAERDGAAAVGDDVEGSMTGDATGKSRVEGREEDG
jgi:hypothetical protein